MFKWLFGSTKRTMHKRSDKQRGHKRSGKITEIKRKSSRRRTVRKMRGG
jgi:hypothetical protein